MTVTAASIGAGAGLAGAIDDGDSDSSVRRGLDVFTGALEGIREALGDETPARRDEMAGERAPDDRGAPPSSDRTLLVGGVVIVALAGVAAYGLARR